MLGYAQGSTIWIDTDAAGHGWFLDRTPWDDLEFGKHTGPEGMDLLTVLAHKMGHVLGFEHGEGVMAERLGSGERHLDRDPRDYDLALFALLAKESSDDDYDENWWWHKVWK